MPSLFTKLYPTLKPSNLSLAKGEKLFIQGDKVTNFYLIKSGKIKLIRNTIDGTTLIAHIGYSDETIAEASLFSNHYHCSAVADLPSTVSFIKKEDLLLFLEENPLAMKNLLSIFAKQVRDLRSINEIKNIRSAKGRILALIKSTMNKNEEMLLDLPLKDIAHKIGLAHETFYRELKKLEESGLILRNDSYIKLTKKS